MKPKMLDYFTKVAIQTAMLSNCKKIAVGAIIVKDDHIVSMGYNGTPPGLMNCGDFFEHKHYPSHEDFLVAHREFSDEREIHAEQNAIAFAAKQGVAVEGATMFVTFTPCRMCAKLIIATGIKNVYYISEYEPSGLTLLEEAGVKTYRIITKEQHQE